MDKKEGKRGKTQRTREREINRQTVCEREKEK